MHVVNIQINRFMDLCSGATIKHWDMSNSFGSCLWHPVQFLKEVLISFPQTSVYLVSGKSR